MEPNEGVHLEKDELTGDSIISGHEYDGIKELDNSLPKWWLGLFYITIAFAVIYLLRYHVLGWAPLQEEEYKNELAVADDKYKQPAGGQLLDATTAVLLEDEASLAAGKVTYDKLCSVCHLPQGQGIVGPNLTDDYWIHGCKIGDLFNIIVVGVPAKGMISWKDQLTPEQIQEVASYILSLVGTNPPNPKEPQGELCQ